MREAPSAETLNARLQQTILRSPEQYLWGYNRYRRPPGAPRREEAGASGSGSRGAR
jgi:KDO2-lipid IV(A) lauroyltransferase